MTTPTISVLIPYRDAEPTLRCALDSLLTQTWTDFEVILVNDRSGDASLDIVTAYVAQDRRIISISNPGIGIVDALNVGLSHCRAPWIARMDADDICHPDRLGKQLALAHRSPSISVISCLVEAFPAPVLTAGMLHYLTWLNSLVTSNDIAREIWVESPIAHPSALIRADVLHDIGGYFNGDFPEDYDLWLRLHNAGHRFDKVPETLFYWRDGPTRLSRTDSRYGPNAFRDLKARHLTSGPLLHHPQVQIWGAGPDGKAWGRVLAAHGRTVVHYLDIDSRKIGGKIGGKTPVVSYLTVPDHRDLFLLGAVGAKGARPQIRSALSDFGFHETLHYLFVQ